jgi:hypothetical protein
MDKLSYLHAVESLLGRDIAVDSLDEWFVYDCYDNDDSAQYCADMLGDGIKARHVPHDCKRAQYN